MAVNLRVRAPVGEWRAAARLGGEGVALDGAGERLVTEGEVEVAVGDGQREAGAAVEARNEALLVELSTTLGLSDRGAAILEDIAVRRLEHRAAPVALFMLPFLNGMLVRQLQRWAPRHVDGDRAAAVGLAKDWVLQTRRLRLFDLIRDLFHYWHVFHKPFAIIMIVVMVVHVVVAVMLGYTWEFGS